MKKVYIDRLLKKYIVPTELRDNSVTERGGIFTSGTRIAVPNDSVIRLFTSWALKTETDIAHFDIDLSIIGADKNGKTVSVAFYDQTKSYANTSGDMRHCFSNKLDKRAAEFLDIDIKEAKNSGIKYFTTLANIFSTDGFTSDFVTDVETHCGIIILDSDERKKKTKEDLDINQSFFKMRLSTPNKTAYIGLVLDVEKSEIIIVDQYQDLALHNSVLGLSNIIQLYKKNYFDALDYKANMFDFLTTYCEANDIEIVESIEWCDTYISYEDYDKLKDNQEMFNISNNLEKIISLLN